MAHATLLLALLTLSSTPARPELAGTVVDAAQKPVPQATVFIYTAKPRVGLGILCPSCYADCSKTATTDANGKFSISALDPELIFTVLVVAEGFKPQLKKDVNPLKGPADVKIEAMPSSLSGRAVLRGRVLDKDGKPVVGAIASPTGCERADRRWGGQMPGVDPASVTNLRGEFLITGNLGDMAYDLDVEARGFAKLKIELLSTGEKIHEIRLTSGATVRGQILKEGKPVSGIAVGLVQCSLNSQKFVGLYKIATNDAGRFTFVNVHPNDEYFVFTPMNETVRFGGILPLKTVTLGADGTASDAGELSLSPTFYRLSGRIVLTDGKAVPSGLRLWLAREIGWDSATSAVIAADGSFSFAGVPEETVTLGARIPGYRLAGKRNRFQQIREGTIAIFVDADKMGLEIFFEPEAAAP